MNDSRHDTWALRINQAIRARARRPSAPDLERLSIEEMLLALAAEAAAVVGAIGRNIDAVQVSGNSRQASLRGFLAEMLPHRQFSLLEYRYTLPGGEQPGLRFQVDLDASPSCVEVQRFADLQRWRGNPGDRGNFTVPIRFELHEEAIRPAPQPETRWAFATCTDWQSAVRETLALPFRQLYDPELTAA
jgi:hypothetical protein